MDELFGRSGRLVAMAAVLWGAGVAQSVADSAGVTELDAVVVTATRVEARNFDLPVSIDALESDVIQDQTARVLVSEVLKRVPGTLVTNRGTFAQEEQIMIRGFGGRSQFGTRGIKLVADGIPASTPDGQGGPGLFDLGSAGDIEVMRGGFSALYGNHSGGVVQVFTEDGPVDPTLSMRLMAGSDGTWIAGSKFGGQFGDLNGVVDAYHSETDGYRDWSASIKDQVNAKLKYALPSGGTLSLIANSMNLPNSRDPLGLTAEQVREDPRQASEGALIYKTRRTLDNMQGGVILDQPVSDADQLRVMAYSGTRSNEQFLAVPLFSQNAITSAGGVSTYDRHFGGASLWWSHESSLAEGPLTLTLGGDYDRSTDDREGYINEYGTRGALKRNEDNSVDSWGGFVQGSWAFAPRWSLDVGLRRTQVRFDSDDHFICTTEQVTAPGTSAGTCSGSTVAISESSYNPDNSGSKTYSAWTPAFGLLFGLTPDINLYANVGKTFETPTFTELAYRPDGGSGLNLDLEPAISWHYELGAKFLLGDRTRLNLALFQIDTDNEITVATNRGGRSTYQNVPGSRRRGAELMLASEFDHGFAGHLAATYIDSVFTDSFVGCAGIPCRTTGSTLNAATVDSGNQVPGVPEFSVFGELSYAYAPWGFEGGVSVYGQDAVYVNDRNTETAAGYWLLNLRGGFTQRMGGLELSEFVRVDNVLDRDYISGVRANDANGRYYAPGAGATYLVGLTASYAF
ncbi:TonB-dependent receptor [Thiorhodococcus drewsii AZ1]|uniref:TonB-dependent receptor n=1 Tax=Thiorhodococcus drewsii AZ1 TaxID=765913 RepID=G2DX18_9GAMM|nr:TonB-dependent receptor [Thiorhodococcus drewsii]EGV33372.1 TonB-dependent receptor [Thiorhodococcus drewsii AZ1]